MANLNDDDTAATRIHHADGSHSSGPVTAPCTVWASMLALLPAIIIDSDINALRNQLVALNAAP